MQMAWQRNRTESQNAGEENILLWNCQLSSYWVLESSCFLVFLLLEPCSCVVLGIDWTDEERARDELLSKKKGVVQGRRTVLYQGRGREKRKKADSSPNRRGENQWKVLGEGVKWKVAASDTNVAVRADNGTSLQASLTVSRCFKASLFLLAPLSWSMCTHIHN